MTTFTISAVKATNTGTSIPERSINFGGWVEVASISGRQRNRCRRRTAPCQSAGTFTVTATAVEAQAPPPPPWPSSSSVPRAFRRRDCRRPPVVGATSTIYTFTATATPVTAVIGNYTWNLATEATNWSRQATRRPTVLRTAKVPTPWRSRWKRFRRAEPPTASTIP